MQYSVIGTQLFKSNWFTEILTSFYKVHSCKKKLMLITRLSIFTFWNQFCGEWDDPNVYLPSNYVNSIMDCLGKEGIRNELVILCKQMRNKK